ncbi:MAG: ATP-binding protein [Imperialibacter sp.]|uniref:ATP-binding protein n=1 Tax=Imperialibacter sp. TaxID=2038411 RepID=UPI0032EADBF5
MEDFKPRIGKNVIETLTLGMYENPFFIYREYVQNAADQIDVAVEERILEKKSDGIIAISIDKQEHRITIEDNATGIRREESLRFLGDIADSQKDPSKRKGFRGIGRLGGLGYCEKLVFETSYSGEFVKTVISLDAKKLKELLADRFVDADAAQVISLITTLEGGEAEKDDHYFRVHLVNVTKNELLDPKLVKDYLSLVAPIPFSNDFIFKEKIKDFYFKRGFKIEEYDVQLNVNEERLSKAYKLHIVDKDFETKSTIVDVDFFQIHSSERKLVALGWYGISDGLNKVLHSNNIERGLRIRKSNIQIGDEDTCNKFFKEDRYNHHFVGEIHVLGDAFIPNARRDYFNDGKIVEEFQNKLRNDVTTQLTKLAHISSKIHSRLKEIAIFKEQQVAFDSMTFVSQDEKIHYQDQLNNLRKKAIKANEIIEKIDVSYDYNSAEGILVRHLVGDSDIVIGEINQRQHESNYTAVGFSKINNSQEEIVLEIFSVLDRNLDRQDAERIKQIIIEKYR